VPALGALIFAITYVLISAQRVAKLGIDRPAAALAGAAACVAFSVLSPEEAIAAINVRTLVLLFGVMGIGAFLSVDGFFEHAEAALVRPARTPARLLGALVWGSGALAALLTNDAVCVLGAPLVVGLVRRLRLPPLPFLLALATGANTGSVATLVGNPQNMLCGLLGGLEFGAYLARMLPVALAGLAVNHGVLWLVHRGALGDGLLEAPLARPASRAVKLDVAVLLATSALFVAGADLAWTAAAGFAVLMVLHRRTTALWSKIDGALLVFFAGLFVVVAGLGASGLPARFFDAVPLAGVGTGWRGWSALSAIFLVGSNVVSNVPFILVVREAMGTLAERRLGWELLAMTSTFAGNLTLLGSVANVIVAEAGREVGGIGFRDHLRVGLPIGLITTALGTAWLLALRGL
jgi:Na+/H+ antiporter NhaD/arsenite permease-like protein